MTDVNSMQYHPSSSHIGDETNHSFVLNESNMPMDIDDDDLLSDTPIQMNGHISPSSMNVIQNEIHYEKEADTHFQSK